MLKERYFTPETIQKKSREMLASIESIRSKHADLVFRPKVAALLVLDLQEYFLQETSHAFIPSATAILPGVTEMMAAFTDADQPVIATRHFNTSKNAGMMSKWWRDLISPQSVQGQNIAVINIPNIHYIKKTQYDAFLQTDLENRLRKLGIEQVVVTGVMTHLCCETTARSAFMHGFEVFFTVDGTATYNEKLHRASLLTLSHGFALPVMIEELLQILENDEG